MEMLQFGERFFRKGDIKIILNFAIGTENEYDINC